MTAKKDGDATAVPALKSFSGTLRMAISGAFGFVGDVYVEPKWIQDLGLENEAQLSAKPYYL
ncbi:hypothetical protein A3SI_15418 [Nitritalea halalkaliphila LW7]|uniref:TOTE conflict systems S1/CSD-like domain-containing protein n=1 Tax=Nitritalea halalkaliphila LW7 TaxID=1189621 RepID=I5BYD5_9BACT|nr:hypothetical protein [Nitritalea halalkaliphila]EIM74587.1 hypothetical protein A3SI_15418 [Nitritalea halalkaliphila LW7]